MKPERARSSLLRLVVAGVLGAAPLTAQQKTGPGESGATAQTLAEIRHQYSEALQAWSKRFAAAKEDADRTRLAASYPQIGPYAERILAVVARDPTSDEAGSALVWLVERGASGAHLATALELLAEHHLDHARIGGVCLRLRFHVGEQERRFLEAVRDGAAHPVAKALAIFALAGLWKRRAEAARRLAADPQRYEAYRSSYGEATARALRDLDAARAEEESLRLYRICASEHADVVFYGVSLGAEAKNAIFELENLRPGQPAPDIEGEDVDGVRFRLSDYRGKVVMLDFWGDW